MKAYYLNPITLFFPKSVLLLEFVHAIGLCEYEFCPGKKSITAQLKEMDIEIAKVRFNASFDADTARQAGKEDN